MRRKAALAVFIAAACVMTGCSGENNWAKNTLENAILEKSNLESTPDCVKYRELEQAGGTE